MKTKYFLQALLICTSFILNAQTKVSINNATISISPSYTVNNATPISITGQVKNVGTTTITANVHVNMAIDTSSTSTPKYFKRSTATTPVVGFAPNAIINFTVTDVAHGGNGYKIAGNGTTIVVWTCTGLSTDTATIQDSVFSNVYVIDLTSINEFTVFENNPIYFNNPAISTLYLNYNPMIYTSIELEDATGKVISKIEDTTLGLSNYSKGIYYLKCHSRNKIVTKKIIIL